MTTTTTFEHTSVVLHLDEKQFALRRSDSLHGLAPESARLLSDLGAQGWELISVVAYSRSILISGATNAMIGFFKRSAA